MKLNSFHVCSSYVACIDCQLLFLQRSPKTDKRSRTNNEQTAVVTQSRDSDEAQFSDDEVPEAPPTTNFDPSSDASSRKFSADSTRDDLGRVGRPSFKPLEEALVSDSANELMLHPDFK